MRYFIFLTVPMLFLTCTSASKVSEADSLAVVNGVTAHRGYSMAYPENTLPAFQAGVDARADWVELDVHRTKDGQLVIIHDKTTERTGDRNLTIADATYEELLEVDVATAFRNKHGLTLKDCPPHRIPLLKEAIALIMKQRRTRLSIQPKVDCVSDAIAIITYAQAENIVGFNDASLPFMSTAKSLAPKIPVFWDRPADTDVEADIITAKERGFESIVIHYSGITAEKINKIKAAGMQVGAWTVNDRPILERLIKKGIDRIYTDDPKLLITIKKELDTGRR